MVHRIAWVPSVHPKELCWCCFPQQWNAMMGPLSIYVRLQGGVLGRFQGSCWEKVLGRVEAGSKQVPEVPGTVPVSFQIKFSNKLPSMVEPRLDPLRSAGGASNHSTHAPCWPSM